MWPKVYEKVELEIAQIDHLFSTYQSVFEKAGHESPDYIEVAALGVFLHSFYNGIENIFKQISVEIDGAIPEGDAWHRTLNNLMAQSTEQRPAVISEDLRNQLIPYLGFRHVFRHAYSFELEWYKMSDLILKAESTWGNLKSELEAFFSKTN